MSKDLQPLARPPTPSQSVQEAIKSYIVDNNLQVDDRLPAMATLAKELGVSSSLVNKALKVMELAGLVEIRPSHGVFVKISSFDRQNDADLPHSLLFDLEDLVDLSEVRRILELGMIEMAIQAMTNEQLSQLQQIVEKMRTLAEYGEPFVQEDYEFHQCLFKNLNNQVLLKLLDTFWLIFRIASQYYNIEDKNPMHTYREHAAIVNAVRAKNTIQARITLDQHYDSLRKRMAQVHQGT